MRKVILAAALLFGLLLAGCDSGNGTTIYLHNPAKQVAEEAIWPDKTMPELLQAWQDRDEHRQVDLATSFFRYYASYEGAYSHPYELRLLPEFVLGEEPSWDEVSHWLCYFADYDPEAGGFAAADMAAAAARLLPDYELPRESSIWLDYDGEKDSFAPVGWDDHGAEYYVLQGITSDGEIYRAQFLVFEVDEMWFDEVYASTSANDAALLAYARAHGGIEEKENEITVTQDVPAAMERLLLDNLLPDGTRNEPEPGMVSRACVEVRFRLSGDEGLPFTYLSCRRWPQDQTLGEAFSGNEEQDF